MLLVRDQLSEALDIVTQLSAEAFAAVRQVILEKLWLEFECLNAPASKPRIRSFAGN
jgi:hypothetical protein